MNHDKFINVAAIYSSPGRQPCRNNSARPCAVMVGQRARQWPPAVRLIRARRHGGRVRRLRPAPERHGNRDPTHSRF